MVGRNLPDDSTELEYNRQIARIFPSRPKKLTIGSCENLFMAEIIFETVPSYGTLSIH